MRPPREPVRQSDQTYFVTFQTVARLAFFKRERWADLLLQTLAHYGDKYDLHDFVIMPDHVHILFTPHEPVERAIQLIKGGYSFKAKRAFEWNRDIWQPGFSDHRIRTQEDWRLHVSYISKNIDTLRVEGYKYCGKSELIPLYAVPPWLKPLANYPSSGGAEAPPQQNV